MQSLKAKLGGRLDALKRYLAFDCWTRLMLATPVDLGQARAGWKATVDDIDLSVPERPKGNQKVAPPSVPDVSPSDNPNRVYWVTNNVHHITFLVAGSSSKAPSGFHDVAVAQTVSILDQLVAQVVGADGGL
jgi:hypothetical protein